MSKTALAWTNKSAKISYLKAGQEKAAKKFVDYDRSSSHNIGDYVSHLKFGYGFVQKIIGTNKIEVFFEDSEKTLLQNWNK